MTDAARVRSLLGQALEVDPPSSIGVTASRVRREHLRRRRRVLLSGASAVVIVVVGAGVGARGIGGPAKSVARQHGDGRPASHGSISSSAADAPAEKVVTDGDILEASGRVVKVPGKPVRFCGPEEFPTESTGTASPLPRWCPLGVDVLGVDLAKLERSRTSAGATEGFAFLRGTWLGGVLHVSVQAAPLYPAAPNPAISPPECRRPANGWAVSTSPNPSPALLARIHEFEASHPGEIVSQAVARPEPRTNYMLLAVQHPSIADAALHPVAGELCILQSRYTTAQLTAVETFLTADQQAHLTDGEGTAAETGPSVAPDGQAEIVTQVVMMTKQVRAWITQAPPGILKVTPWLRPVAAGAPLPTLSASVPDVVTTGVTPATSVG